MIGAVHRPAVSAVVPCMTPPAPPRPTLRAAPIRARRRLTALAAVLAGAATLSGCGGGLYLGYEWGGGWSDDGPPRVSISALPPVVDPGGLLVMGANAADADGIVEVTLYRLDGDFATPVGTDRQPPWQWQTVIPGDGRRTVAYFARAVDGVGRFGDSAVVSAAVRF